MFRSTRAGHVARAGPAWSRPAAPRSPLAARQTILAIGARYILSLANRSGWSAAMLTLRLAARPPGAAHPARPSGSWPLVPTRPPGQDGDRYGWQQNKPARPQPHAVHPAGAALS